MIRCLAAGLAALLLLLGAPVRAQQSAPAAPCGPLRDPTDRAICGSPGLAAADMAMAFAEKGREAELPAELRPALRLDQQIWLRARAGSCADIAGEARVACLLAVTEARRRMLTGGGINRDRGAPRIDPVFFHEAKSGRYEIDIAYPQIVGARNAGQAAFNKAARDLVLGDAALMGEFRSADHADGGGAASSSVAFYDIHYLGPRLATVIYWLVSGNRGWQHPFTARETLVFDFALGRPLLPEDVLISPVQAAGAIVALCRRRLAELAQQQGWTLRADPSSVVANFRNWALGPFALEILFDPGTIAAEAAGLHTCRLDYAELFSVIKRH